MLHTTTPLEQTLPAIDASGFPSALYPPPLPARAGSNPSSCPAPAGLRAFDARARAAAANAARHVDVAPLWNGLQFSDRAWWAGLYTDQIDGQYGQGVHRVVSVRPAAADPYAGAAARACGQAVLALSLAIIVGPGVYSSQVSHLFFLDRDGRPLLYWQHT